jgi:hypothetical protein
VPILKRVYDSLVELGLGGRFKFNQRFIDVFELVTEQHFPAINEKNLIVTPTFLIKLSKPKTVKLFSNTSSTTILKSNVHYFKFKFLKQNAPLN